MGIFEGDILDDEMALYETMKTLIQEWHIKRYDVRFFVPDSTVMMKTFEHPSDITSAKLKGYVEMELGRTIHLPFSQPLIDVYDFNPNDGEAVLFAAPSEEVHKIAGLLDDLHLDPSNCRCKVISYYSLFREDNWFGGKQELFNYRMVYIGCFY